MNAKLKQALRPIYRHVRHSLLRRKPDGIHLSKAYWGDQAQQRAAGQAPILSWLDTPYILQTYVYPAISGQPNQTWLDVIKKEFLTAPASYALSIGCGHGDLERHAIRERLAERVDAFDVAPQAIAVARQKADEAGIGDKIFYHVADLNRHRYEQKKYDAVFACMSLHHVKRLEFGLDQIARSMRPGGHFFVNEFIGPSQFQWTDKQLRLANDALRLIPERLRRDILTGRIKTEALRPTLEHMNNCDPTESICSSRIMTAVEERFEVVKRVDYGGTLFQLTLENIAGNFEDTAEDRQILDKLIALERGLIANGELPSDFTFFVARLRDA